LLAAGAAVENEIWSDLVAIAVLAGGQLAADLPAAVGAEITRAAEPGPEVIRVFNHWLLDTLNTSQKP